MEKMPRTSIYNLEKQRKRALAALDRDYMTDADRRLIKLYIQKKKARKNISEIYANDIMFSLAKWRRFIHKPYDQITKDDVDEGLAELYNATTARGTPFRPNTAYRLIKDLRIILFWLSKEGHIQLSRDYIKEDIPLPRQDFDVEDSEDLLTPDDITAMIDKTTSSKNRALLAMLYECGVRISELCRIQWKHVSFDDHGVTVKIWDSKRKQWRENWLKVTRPYLAAWKNDHKHKEDPDALVFVARDQDMLSYCTCDYLIKKAAQDAGIKKRVHLHLFRKSRITHMYAQNYNPSIIKEIMWKNQTTQMEKVYVKLSRKDVQNELKRKAGVQVPGEELQAPAIQDRPCARCHLVNAPTDIICRACGYPLTREAFEASKTLDQEIRGRDDFRKIMMEDVIKLIDERLASIKK